VTTDIIVTGATGNTGAEVIKRLPSDRIRAAVRDVAKAQEKLGSAINYVTFDFKKPQTYEDAFQSAKKLFLVRPPAISNVNAYIAPVIDSAVAAGIEHIVFLSLMGVESVRFVPHYKIEQAIIASGAAWTFLRAGFFMQNLNTTHRDEIANRDEIFVPAGNGKTSFIDIRDIAAVAARALIVEEGHIGRAYTLTGGEALSYDEAAAILSEVLGRPIHYAKPSLPHFIWRKWREGTPLGFAFIMAFLYMNTRSGRAARVTPDVEKLLSRPPITFRQYVEDYKAYWTKSACPHE
jgi:uncharacterized protein YbjT (DUF2867 family)